MQVVNESAGAAAASETNDFGPYQVPFLLPGVYTLRAEKEGCRRIERQMLGSARVSF